MHNISWRIYEIPIETKKQNERPRRLEGTISGSKEWLEEIVAKGFLTEDEENFFNELENPVEIKEIAKKIISEICKRICDWENPSRKLFEQVCNDITRMRSGMYPWYTKAVLGQLPDRKKIADLFESDNTNSNKDVEEFRKKRKEYMNSKINAKLASPDDPIRNEIPVNPEPKIRRVEAQSYNIKNDVWHYISFPSFTRSENIETTLPMLKQEDVCIACFHGWFEEVTKNTKVPYFDMRGNQRLIEWLWIKKDWKLSIPKKIWCLYNPRDDVSHICVFWNEPGGRSRADTASTMMIGIKGKISQKDAIDLIWYLKENNGLKFHTYDNYPLDPYNTDRTKIQKAIVEYFNNK